MKFRKKKRSLKLAANTFAPHSWENDYNMNTKIKWRFTDGSFQRIQPQDIAFASKMDWTQGKGRKKTIGMAYRFALKSWIVKKSQVIWILVNLTVRVCGQNSLDPTGTRHWYSYFQVIYKRPNVRHNLKLPAFIKGLKQRQHSGDRRVLLLSEFRTQDTEERLQKRAHVTKVNSLVVVLSAKYGIVLSEASKLIVQSNATLTALQALGMPLLVHREQVKAVENLQPTPRTDAAFFILGHLVRGRWHSLRGTKQNLWHGNNSCANFLPIVRALCIRTKPLLNYAIWKRRLVVVPRRNPSGTLIIAKSLQPL